MTLLHASILRVILSLRTHLFVRSQLCIDLRHVGEYGLALGFVPLLTFLDNQGMYVLALGLVLILTRLLDLA